MIRSNAGVCMPWESKNSFWSSGSNDEISNSRSQHIFNTIDFVFVASQNDSLISLLSSAVFNTMSSGRMDQNAKFLSEMISVLDKESSLNGGEG